MLNPADPPANTAAAKDARTGHTSPPAKLEHYTYHIDLYARLDKRLESLRSALKEARQSRLNRRGWEYCNENETKYDTITSAGRY